MLSSMSPPLPEFMVMCRGRRGWSPSAIDVEKESTRFYVLPLFLIYCVGDLDRFVFSG
jgi:hypothetical protein